MPATKNRAVLFLGTLLLLFGLGCLNYTRADGLDHHRAFARRNNLPEPSATVFFLGVAAVTIGSVAAGFAIGRGRKNNVATISD